MFGASLATRHPLVLPGIELALGVEQALGHSERLRPLHYDSRRARPKNSFSSEVSK